jgi:hypothetical protein
MKITKPGFLKKDANVAALCGVLLALLALAGFLHYAGSPGAEAQRRANDDVNPCRGKADGAPCPLEERQGAPPGPCRAGRCRGLAGNRYCANEPAPAGTPCADTDGNPCTVARCSAAGACDQRSQLRANGTPCNDGTPGCGGGQSCRAGQCLPPPGAGDPSQVAMVNVMDVGVVAAVPRVRQATAFNDCCVLCEHQNLEAIAPTSQGPRPTETDGQLPLRRKFCGAVMRYGVNNEMDDPRDITIDILPTAAPYFDFVAGLVNTEMTPLSGADRTRFGPDNWGRLNCDVAACQKRAAEIRGKVIHAEVTPDEHFYGADGRFMPVENNVAKCGFVSGVSAGHKKCLNCLDGWDCQSELESPGGRPGAEVCVYGVYALDHGGHSASSHRQFCCSKDPGHDRPEIHPFDAIWWRHPASKGWIFGVFQDDSNRYSFPYCGSDNNGNEWSQAPRDLTFRFPFRFPRSSGPQKVCLRHVRTRALKDNAANIVRPLNVTTGAFVTPETEATTLTITETVAPTKSLRQRWLEVIKEPNSERETHVRVTGSFVGNDVVGEIILRVAVGCDDRAGSARCSYPAGPRDHRQTLFDGLRQTNGLVTYDKDDAGAGYYYAELTFECACSFR